MTHRLLTIFIVLVWLTNGLHAKILGMAPRHEAIVARIVGGEFARELVILIGVAEVVLGLWVAAGYFRKPTAIFQVTIVLIMNLLETWLAPDLLLWGHWNMLYALLFCGVVYYHGFRSTFASHAV